MSREVFAALSDKQVGTLEVGKLADLAALSQDIFSVPPETIGKTRVLTTMVGGKVECAFRRTRTAPRAGIRPGRQP
jgi:predicted amidohydrolase YtcJ